MKLSDFIRANIELILEKWEQFTKDLPSARYMSREDVRDHAAGILSAIAADLDRPETPAEQEKKSKGLGPRSAGDTYAAMHGSDRKAEGLSISEAVSEFRFLRAIILRLWSEANPTLPQPCTDDVTRFNEAIDQALTISVERYSTDMGRYTRLFSALLASSPDLNYIFDADGTLVYGNKSLASLCRLSLSEIVGKNFFDLCAPLADELRQQALHVIDNKTAYRGEMPYTLASGEVLAYEYIFIPVLDDEGNVEAIAGTARDITERKAAEERISKSANYDHLTGLPNRSLFRDRLDQEVKRSLRTGQPIALLFIDLDDFKQVNDRLGHDGGDQLLLQAAQRISSCVRSMDTVARLGGDEFTVILTEVNRLPHIEILTQKILEELSRPFSILQTEVYISGSIGITLFPQDAATSEDLVRNADQAMYVSKSAGRNRFSFFTIGMRNSAWARLKVIDELRCALPQNQLAVYYQPIVELQLERIVKAEALLRWKHPQAGLMRSEQFIAIAEETGLIGEIDEWVLGEAMAHAREWSALLDAPFQITVNKSPIEFISREPMKNWAAHLAALGLAWNCIAMEITEGVLLNNSPIAREKLESLQKAGVQLAIDDFGSGYSSMAYLKKFKIDYLKIDPSFVRDMAACIDSRAIAEAIIVMAHKLGLKVIAEGVETIEQKDWLKKAGCDYAQGYFFSGPLSSEDFSELLRKGKVPPQGQAYLGNYTA